MDPYLGLAFVFRAGIRAYTVHWVDWDHREFFLYMSFKSDRNAAIRATSTAAPPPKNNNIAAATMKSWTTFFRMTVTVATVYSVFSLSTFLFNSSSMEHHLVDKTAISNGTRRMINTPGSHKQGSSLMHFGSCLVDCQLEIIYAHIPHIQISKGWQPLRTKS